MLLTLCLQNVKHISHVGQIKTIIVWVNLTQDSQNETPQKLFDHESAQMKEVEKKTNLSS